jgi:hypothetical protein
MSAGSSTQHECDMDKIMANEQIAQFLELLWLFGQPLTSTSNISTGEIAARLVTAEPPIKEIDNRLSRLERLWLEQKDPQTVARAIRIASLSSAPLPLWLSAAAVELVDKRISPTERRKRGSLLKHFVRALAVTEYKLEGKTLDESHAAASTALEGSEAQGGEDMMCTSYKTIQRQWKEGRRELLTTWLEGMSLMGMDVREHATFIVGAKPHKKRAVKPRR